MALQPTKLKPEITQQQFQKAVNENKFIGIVVDPKSQPNNPSLVARFYKLSSAPRRWKGVDGAKLKKLPEEDFIYVIVRSAAGTQRLAGRRGILDTWLRSYGSSLAALQGMGAMIIEKNNWDTPQVQQLLEAETAQGKAASPYTTQILAFLGKLLTDRSYYLVNKAGVRTAPSKKGLGEVGQEGKRRGKRKTLPELLLTSKSLPGTENKVYIVVSGVKQDGSGTKSSLVQRPTKRAKYVTVRSNVQDLNRLVSDNVEGLKNALTILKAANLIPPGDYAAEINQLAADLQAHTQPSGAGMFFGNVGQQFTQQFTQQPTQQLQPGFGLSGMLPSTQPAPGILGGPTQQQQQLAQLEEQQRQLTQMLAQQQSLAGRTGTTPLLQGLAR